MSKSLIIVESPTKAKTLAKFLGKNYEVNASYGHVRDLPNTAAEIPEKYKKLKWAKLGINVENNFEPLYIIPDDKAKRVKELKSALKDATELYLATDEDREGESISWHLLEILNPKIPVKRLVFHEITKDTILKALQETRDINENLVKAQETRRIVDRLFGYTVSPLLWKKMAPRLSAGRVQSVAMRLLVERERQRIKFVTSQFWDLEGTFGVASAKIVGELIGLGDKRIAIGKDFEPETGLLKNKNDVLVLNKDSAEKLATRLSNSLSKVLSVEEKPYSTNPSPPFTTSTLQQEASRKLIFSARRTMQVAQKLYENGFITYMRTDSTNLSEEAILAARNIVKNQYGSDYLPPQPRIYKTKVKNVQEAHEAIRPAGQDFASFEKVLETVGSEGARLYELIWKRAVACQMKNCEGTRITVKIGCDDAIFRTSGKTILFPGYLRAYVEGSDDPEAELADKETILPPLKQGESLKTLAMKPLEHNTQPPARYTEGTLIRELERLGIGRPSTWATIVDVVLSRTYGFKKGTALVPTFLAMAVTGLMEKYLPNVIDYEFTAKLEEDLDSISRGEAANLEYLREFFLGSRPGLEALVKKGEETIDPREVCGIPLANNESEEVIEIRIGRYGPFLTDGTTRAGLPLDIAPEDLNIALAKDLLDKARKGPDSLGTHPESGKQIFVKSGRYGPYVQEGEAEEGEKPKMASLIPGMNIDSITIEEAIGLLSLPRTLGIHPENGEEIIAAHGRYGSYIKCGTDNRSIVNNSPLTITLTEALELLKQPKTRGRKGTVAPLRELGKHPVTNLPLIIKSGRYGPYITDGKINASVPKDNTVEEITLEEAVNLIDARADKV
jgi:DNA topoisomerase I